jgi:membrane protein implicated in regulation of membrane protease activity
MAKRMKRETRWLLQRVLTVASFLVAGVVTALWVQHKSAGVSSPLWLLGVVGYSWTFVGFLALQLAARSLSKKYRNR